MVTPWTEADGNGDGVVNNSDYVLWRKQMSIAGGASLGAGAAIPEPTSALLLIAAGAIAVLALQRRHRALVPRRTCFDTFVFPVDGDSACGLAWIATVDSRLKDH